MPASNGGTESAARAFHERTPLAPGPGIVIALVLRFSVRTVRAWRRARRRATTAIRGLLSRATFRGRRSVRGRAGERQVRSARGALRGDHPLGRGGGHAPSGARFAAGLPPGRARGWTARGAAGDGARAHR